MAFAIRVDEDYIGLMGRYVAEGQSIVPGAPLVDVMTPDGVVQTIFSQGWGVVGHVEGSRIFSSHANDLLGDDETYDDDEEEDEEGGAVGSGGGSSVFPRGSVICHIVARSQGGNTRKTGLHPRNATGPMMRRLMGLAPR
jgi:hypothetical protein